MASVAERAKLMNTSQNSTASDYQKGLAASRFMNPGAGATSSQMANAQAATTAAQNAISTGNYSALTSAGASGGSYGSSRSRSSGSSGGGLAAVGGGGGIDYDAYLAQAREAAQRAYDAVIGAAGRMRDSAFSLADENYNYGSGRLNDARDKSLRESYISNELAKRNLSQRLSYTGRSGGAAESTMLGLENSYGTARGEVESSRQEGLADLARQRAQERAAAEQMYQQYVMQAEENLANRLASYDTSAMQNAFSAARSSGGGGTASATALSNLLKAGQSAASRQAATNAGVTGAGLVPTTNAAAAAAANNQLTAGRAYLESLVAGHANMNQDWLLNKMNQAGYSPSQIAAIMNM